MKEGIKLVLAIAFAVLIVVSVVQCVNAFNDVAKGIEKCAPGVETVHSKDGRDVSAIVCTGEKK